MRSTRYLATCGSRELVVYGRTERQARSRLPRVPLHERWTLREAGYVEGGVLHLPSDQQARIVVEGRRAPSA